MINATAPQLVHALRRELAQHARVGDWSSTIDYYTSSAYDYALYVLNTPARAVDWYKAELKTSYVWMTQALDQAVASGNRNIQSIVATMAGSVANAIAAVGNGTGAALEALLGGKPKDILDTILLAAAFGVATLAVVAMSPTGGVLAAQAPALLSAIKPKVSW